MKYSIPLYLSPINKLGNSAFRRLCLEFGADFVFTEMIRVEKLILGEEHQIRKLKVHNKFKDKTFVQIIAEDINLIEKGITEVIKYFPEVKEINYNMGCPQSSLCKNECGGGIVANPKLVGKVANILSNVCSKYSIKPSIKIRLGINRDRITIKENIFEIKKNGIEKIYIHGRVLNDTYSRPATFEEIAKIKSEFPDLEIIANGDIKDINSFNKVITKTNPNGVLIGRAALENPKIFQLLKEFRDNYYIKDKNKYIKEIYNNLSGIQFEEKVDLIKKYLEFAMEDKVPISHVKANISYFTKGVINGSKFRKDVNNLSNIKDILNLNYFK